MQHIPRKPGDLILDRRLPDTSPEEREAARERLYAFARVLMKIAARQEREAETVNSPESGGRPRMAA